ncbi:MAG: ROK family protein [Proteobacteria bacterium]|nr:ROK family protein [Pseudomonadota bacterium]
MRIGIDLGGTKIEGIAIDGDGVERARLRVAAPSGDYDATVGAVAALVADLESEAGASADGIGVGIPGAVSPATGLIKNANSTWLIGKPLAGDLEAALGRPVRLANDANCFAVSEAIDGAARGAGVVFGVILGTGVGGGLVIGGKAITGLNAIAGEWGHNPLPWPTDDERPGPACYCSKRGCIETFLSGPGLARDFRQAGGDELAAPDVVALAGDGTKAGNAMAEAALERYEQRLARALASVINILDPDVIVLGGGLSNVGRLYDSVPRLWSDWVFSERVATPLLANVHGDSSGVRGAAWLWEE